MGSDASLDSLSNGFSTDRAASSEETGTIKDDGIISTESSEGQKSIIKRITGLFQRIHTVAFDKAGERGESKIERKIATILDKVIAFKLIAEVLTLSADAAIAGIAAGAAALYAGVFIASHTLALGTYVVAKAVQFIVNLSMLLAKVPLKRFEERIEGARTQVNKRLAEINQRIISLPDKLPGSKIIGMNRIEEEVSKKIQKVLFEKEDIGFASIEEK